MQNKYAHRADGPCGPAGGPVFHYPGTVRSSKAMWGAVGMVKW